MTGLVLETATDHVDVLVCDAQASPLARRVESVGHGHASRLAGLVQAALAEAGVPPSELTWVAADLGPGSFTGVRVGLASARPAGCAAPPSPW